jgi:hypothetical protein
MLGALERTIWFSALLLLGLVVFLLAVLFGLGGRLPELKPLPRAGASGSPFPAAPLPQSFASSAVPSLAVPTNVINPFFTLYFQPPPPPPTKKVPLLYLGCVESSAHVVRAYVRVGEALRILPLGEKVIADHAIKDITLKALVLTNAAGQTNVFEFNAAKPIEVPAN